MKKCPNCEEIIDYLDYRIPTIDRGTADLDGTNLENEEMEDTGEVIYYCPTCGEEIDIDDLIEIEEEEEEEEKPKEPPIHIEKLENTEFYAKHQSMSLIPRLLKCPRCGELTEITTAFERNSNHCMNGNDETEVRCWKCNKKLTTKNLYKLNN